MNFWFDFSLKCPNAFSAGRLKKTRFHRKQQEQHIQRKLIQDWFHSQIHIHCMCFELIMQHLATLISFLIYWLVSTTTLQIMGIWICNSAGWKQIWVDNLTLCTPKSFPSAVLVKQFGNLQYSQWTVTNSCTQRTYRQYFLQATT